LVVRPHTKFTTYPPELLRHQLLTASAFVLLVVLGAFAIVHGDRQQRYGRKIVAQIG
jgi:hypothetical protein